MIFIPTPIAGAYLIELEPKVDERGYLMRMWCKQDFVDHGITLDLVQGYVSFSKNTGTMRGLHYSVAPYGEAKLVRCTRGSVYEVMADVRPDSSSYGKWEGYTLKAADNTMLLVPAYVAHGILTLEDNTEIMNLYDRAYRPGVERGIRYNDPAFSIQYPISVVYVSSKDLAWEEASL